MNDKETIIWIILFILLSNPSNSLPQKLLKLIRTRYETSFRVVENEKVVEVRNESIQLFGKSILKLAILKEKRHHNTTAVCEPQVFKGALFMERESQVTQLESLLFNERNAKKKRNLIAAVASSGMGKSAFVDEFCQKLLVINKNSCIFPIAITFNTEAFGGSVREYDGETSTDLAARLLMSYFLSNPSKHMLREIYDLLIEFGEKPRILRAVVDCIKDDLRTQSGVEHPKILIACDEVGKSAVEKEVVSVLCALIDDDNDVEIFFTGLTLNPFVKESSSGRFIKNVPLPLLTFKASLGLVQSFICGTNSFHVSTKLARLSGGHPRTIQVFNDIIRDKKWNNTLEWSDEMFETTMKTALAKISYGDLLMEEIMLLLRPQTTLNDIKANDVLRNALETGALYATIYSPKDQYVELFTSPMLLRNSLFNQTAQFNSNSVISYLQDLLDLVGLRDLKEFRTANGQQDGKAFESFYLSMEFLRRSVRCEIDQFSYAKKFYPSISYSQNCEIVRFPLVPEYTVENINCKFDFPSSKSADAASITLVKKMIHADAINKVIYPSKRDQAAYDFFFILKDFSTGKSFLQLVEPTFSAGTKGKSQMENDLFFIDLVVHKLKLSEKLAWGKLGVGVDDIIHTFVSSRKNASPINWKEELTAKGLSHRMVIILEADDLRRFYGPMLNVLYSCSFDDD